MSRTALKANGTKARGLSLLAPSFLLAVAAALEHGAEKYEEWDWLHGNRPITDYYDAILRHWLDLLAGRDLDEESGIHHAAHIAAGCMFLLEHYYNGQGRLIDNRNRQDVDMLTVNRAKAAIDAARAALFGGRTDGEDT